MGFKVLSLWSLGFRDWWGFVLRDRRDFVGSTGIGVLFFFKSVFPYVSSRVRTGTPSQLQAGFG